MTSETGFKGSDPSKFKGSDPSVIPVILSGGAGTRLWPLSREGYPKQFLPLIGERTMIQETALRAAGLTGATAPIVVCNEAHRFLVAEQMRELGIEPRAILLEPAGRNTAPAVAVAALAALARPGRDAGPADEPVLLVLPADHVLADVASLAGAVAAAMAAARAGHPQCVLRTGNVSPGGQNRLREGPHRPENAAFGSPKTPFPPVTVLQGLRRRQAVN